jgi:hypothetical protein
MVLIDAMHFIAMSTPPSLYWAITYESSLPAVWANSVLPEVMMRVAAGFISRQRLAVIAVAIARRSERGMQIESARNSLDTIERWAHGDATLAEVMTADDKTFESEDTDAPVTASAARSAARVVYVKGSPIDAASRTALHVVCDARDAAADAAGRARRQYGGTQDLMRLPEIREIARTQRLITERELADLIREYVPTLTLADVIAGTERREW